MQRKRHDATGLHSCLSQHLSRPWDPCDGRHRNNSKTVAIIDLPALLAIIPGLLDMPALLANIPALLLAHKRSLLAAFSESRRRIG